MRVAFQDINHNGSPGEDIALLSFLVEMREGADDISAETGPVSESSQGSEKENLRDQCAFCFLPAGASLFAFIVVHAK